MSRSCQWFDDGFDHPLLRYVAVAITNDDMTTCAARLVGGRCVSVLYLGKLTALMSLRDAEAAARQSRDDVARPQQGEARLTHDVGAPQHDDPLLSESEVRRHLQYLRANPLLAPSPYLLVTELCSLAAALSGEEEELPLIVWSPSDRAGRSLYYDGKLISLDTHHIPGVRAALDSYHTKVRSVTTFYATLLSLYCQSLILSLSLLSCARRSASTSSTTCSSASSTTNQTSDPSTGTPSATRAPSSASSTTAVPPLTSSCGQLGSSSASSPSAGLRLTV